MIHYKTLFWIIDDYNSEHRFSELLKLISEDGFEEYIQGIIDEYAIKDLIETSDEPEYFDRLDKVAISFVDRLNKFLHELIVVFPVNIKWTDFGQWLKDIIFLSPFTPNIILP